MSALFEKVAQARRAMEAVGVTLVADAAERGLPGNTGPFGTMVTKDYPDDARSRLDAPGRWRLNINVGSPSFTELLGYPPESIVQSEPDFSEPDVFLPHPLYGAYGWVSVVNPGPSTTTRSLDALHAAHRADRLRVGRRAPGPSRRPPGT